MNRSTLIHPLFVELGWSSLDYGVIPVESV